MTVPYLSMGGRLSSIIAEAPLAMCGPTSP
jgi:hypothetical protein